MGCCTRRRHGTARCLISVPASASLGGTVRQKPELFCFGLLECCDVKQLAALVAPRPVRFVEPGQRVKDELGGLGAWYRMLGAEFDPLLPG